MCRSRFSVGTGLGEHECLALQYTNGFVGVDLCVDPGFLQYTHGFVGFDQCVDPGFLQYTHGFVGFDLCVDPGFRGVHYWADPWVRPNKTV